MMGIAILISITLACIGIDREEERPILDDIVCFGDFDVTGSTCTGVSIPWPGCTMIVSSYLHKTIHKCFTLSLNCLPHAACNIHPQ